MAELDGKGSSKTDTTLCVETKESTEKSSAISSIDKDGSTKNQTIIHASIIPTSLQHTTTMTGTQQTIVMPPFVDSIYNPAAPVWNGVSYVQPTLSYGAYGQPLVPPVSYYPPGYGYAPAYPSGITAWPGSVPPPPGSAAYPVVPQMPPPPPH